MSIKIRASSSFLRNDRPVPGCKVSLSFFQITRDVVLDLHTSASFLFGNMRCVFRGDSLAEVHFFAIFFSNRSIRWIIKNTKEGFGQCRILLWTHYGEMRAFCENVSPRVSEFFAFFSFLRGRTFLAGLPQDELRQRSHGTADARKFSLKQDGSKDA